MWPNCTHVSLCVTVCMHTLLFFSSLLGIIRISWYGKLTWENDMQRLIFIHTASCYHTGISWKSVDLELETFCNQLQWSQCYPVSLTRFKVAEPPLSLSWLLECKSTRWFSALCWGWSLLSEASVLVVLISKFLLILLFFYIGSQLKAIKDDPQARS